MHKGDYLHAMADAARYHWLKKSTSEDMIRLILLVLAVAGAAGSMRKRFRKGTATGGELNTGIFNSGSK
jgi:hypothetical protein